MEQSDKLITRGGLPDALRVLLEDFPRDVWEAHPNFSGLVAFWLERHVMFRRLTQTLKQDAEATLDAKLDPMQHTARLTKFGSMLITQLHGHHQIEDYHYFPVLAGMAPKLTRGFEILDHDHHDLDGLLNQFSTSANAVLKGGEVGVLHSEILALEGFLGRHLEDEEDLIVPVLLKYGSDGLHGD